MFFIEARIWYPFYENSQALDEGLKGRVTTLQRDLAGLWDTYGASRCSIGRLYNYDNQLSSAARSTLKIIKLSLDPKFILNPGVLGLNSGNDKEIKKTLYPEFPQNLLSSNDDVL